MASPSKRTRSLDHANTRKSIQIHSCLSAIHPSPLTLCKFQGLKQVTSAGLTATPRALTAHSKAHILALPAFGRGCLLAHLDMTLTSQSLIKMFVWHSTCTPLRGWNDVGVEMQDSANALIVSLEAFGPTTASHLQSHQWTYALEMLV
jgi:hypothetical protein